LGIQQPKQRTGKRVAYNWIKKGPSFRKGPDTQYEVLYGSLSGASPQGEGVRAAKKRKTGGGSLRAGGMFSAGKGVQSEKRTVVRGGSIQEFLRVVPRGDCDRKVVRGDVGNEDHAVEKENAFDSGKSKR